MAPQELEDFGSSRSSARCGGRAPRRRSRRTTDRASAVEAEPLVQKLLLRRRARTALMFRCAGPKSNQPADRCERRERRRHVVAIRTVAQRSAALRCTSWEQERGTHLGLDGRDPPSRRSARGGRSRRRREMPASAAQAARQPAAHHLGRKVVVCQLASHMRTTWHLAALTDGADPAAVPSRPGGWRSASSSKVSQARGSSADCDVVRGTVPLLPMGDRRGFLVARGELAGMRG